MPLQCILNKVQYIILLYSSQQMVSLTIDHILTCKKRDLKKENIIISHGAIRPLYNVELKIVFFI